MGSGSITVCSFNSPYGSASSPQEVHVYGFDVARATHRAIDAPNSAGCRDQVFDDLAVTPVEGGIALNVHAPRQMLLASDQMHGLDQTRIEVAGQALSVSVDANGMVQVAGPEGLQLISDPGVGDSRAQYVYAFTPEGQIDEVHVELQFSASASSGADLHVRAWAGGTSQAPHHQVEATLKQLARDGRIERFGHLLSEDAGAGIETSYLQSMSR